MTSNSPASERQRLGLLLVAAAALLLTTGLLAPSVASAAAPSGAPLATFPIGKKGQGLHARGVRVSASGRAKIFDRRYVGLPISDVSVRANRRATLILGGGIKLKKGRRTVTIRGLLVKVKGRSVSISGKIGKRRATIFSGHASPSPKLDAGLQSVDIQVKRLVLTSRAAREVRRSIHSFPPRRAKIGRFQAKAFVTSPTTGPTIDPAAASSCKPTAGASTDPARPVTAVDITCASLIWNLRSSWVGYVSLTQGVAPASGLAPIAEGNHVCPDGSNFNKVATFSYLLPATNGWWDAASSTGNLTSSGGFHFTGEPYPGIKYDIQLTDVELRFHGANSQLWGTLVDKTTGHTPYQGPMHFADFDAAQPIVGGSLAPGQALARLRLKLTSDAVPVFDGFYPAGDGFGCVDVGFNF